MPKKNSHKISAVEDFTSPTADDTEVVAPLDIEPPDDEDINDLAGLLGDDEDSFSDISGEDEDF